MRKQLTAKNPVSGIIIIQRLIDGVRYYKYLPANVSAIAIAGIKKSFEGRPVEVTESKNGWLKIVKTGIDEELESKTKQALKKEGKEEEDVDENYIFEKEAEMLKAQGFNVKIEDI